MIIVDAHVHLHACFDLISCLQAAYSNFKGVVRGQYQGHVFLGVLCLTEGANENGFERLLNASMNVGGGAIRGRLGTWRVLETEEDVSLCLTAGNEMSILVIAGQQLSTQEQLEVLAIGTRQSFTERRGIEETIQEVAQAGALPIVPWGFGKWMGKRRELVERLIFNDQLPEFFLGDNANRPSFLPKSSLFDVAEDRGILNLPGSDPLPFPRDSQRPGQAGFVLEGPLDSKLPARDLKEKLMSRDRPLRTFMQCERPHRFVRNQLAMQYRKFALRKSTEA